MISYKSIIKRLKLNPKITSDSRLNELVNKLSEEDWEYMLTHKEHGYFGQIKIAMENITANSIDIPCIGFLEVNITTIRKKIGEALRDMDFYEKFLLKTDETIADKKLAKIRVEEDLEKVKRFTGHLVNLYLQKDYEKVVTMKNTVENSKKKETLNKRLSVDAITVMQVNEILANPKLTVEGFVYQMKMIKAPITRDWFLVAYQNINDLFRRKTKSKMSKSEFKSMLEEGGLYVDC